MAAVIFKNAFRYDWHIASGIDGDEYDFLGYMTRPEAFSKEKHSDKKSEYYDYLEYMRNDEKSDGAFDAVNDYLDEKQREEFRYQERISQKEGCPKYTGVMSFKNEFLENNGLIKGDKLNKAALRNIARKGINALIEKSDKLSADNCYWAAAIHENTDNIHIHYTLCEYHRLSDRRITEKNNKQDCLELVAFNALKSTVANSIITVKRTPELTRIKRELLIPELKASFPSAEKMLLELAAELPPDAAMQYNNHKIRPYHNKINQCIDRIISSDKQLKKDWEMYTDSLKLMDQQYKEFYGNGDKSHFVDYSENQIDDFYVRAGNALLKHIVQLKKEIDEPEYVDIDEIIKLTAQAEEQAAPPVSERNKKTESDSYTWYILGKKHLEDNLNKAERYLLRSAESDNYYAQYELGKLYLRDEKLDIKKASKWLLKAADNNHPYAQFAYGILSYKTGDHDEGMYYLELSAQNGNEVALSMVKSLSEHQKSKRPIIRKAVYTSRRSVNAAWHTLKNLQSEYDAHIKQLQREFDYENQISSDFDYDYNY